MTQAPPRAAGTPDEVDRITEAWHRERPDLDVAPLQVLSRVTRLSRHIDLARRQAFAAHDLETWEFDVLAALRRSGPPYSLSAGQLGSQTHVTSGTMTNRIDRLEQRGLVRREAEPADRRGVRVVLAEAGRSAVDDALADLMARERDILDVLPSTAQAELATLLRRLVRSFAD
jgi:DNA-binding MarR family transcriptional regulator